MLVHNSISSANVPVTMTGMGAMENGGTHTRADLTALWDKQNGVCPFCNEALTNEVHVDHWVPLILGGSNGPENLRLTHPVCNLRKGARHPSEFGLAF